MTLSPFFSTAQLLEHASTVWWESSILSVIPPNSLLLPVGSMLTNHTTQELHGNV